MQAPAIQHLHGDLKALTLLAEHVFSRNPDIVENHVANMRALLAHLLFGLANAQARQVARH